MPMNLYYLLQLWAPIAPAVMSEQGEGGSWEDFRVRREVRLIASLKHSLEQETSSRQAWLQLFINLKYLGIAGMKPR